jgi:hypothetical protein
MSTYVSQVAATAKQNRNKLQLILSWICEGRGLDALATEELRRARKRTNSTQTADSELAMRETTSRLLSQGLKGAVLALVEEPGGLEDAAKLLLFAAQDSSVLNCGSVVNILFQRLMKRKQPQKVLEVASRLCNVAQRSPAELVRDRGFVTCIM